MGSPPASAQGPPGGGGKAGEWGGVTISVPQVSKEMLGDLEHSGD